MLLSTNNMVRSEGLSENTYSMEYAIYTVQVLVLALQIDDSTSVNFC